jgi:hypothetical protein
MDYHAERIEDYSSVVVTGDEIIGLFPANAAGSILASHNGLTFGGLIYGADQRAPVVLGVFQALVEYYRSAGFNKLIYKAVPHVFHRYPAEDDLYALFRLNGRLIRRDLSAVILPRGGAKISNLRKRGYKKAKKANIIIREGDFYEDFHALLEQVLKRHGAEPVHSISDMNLLSRRVPGRVRLIGAFEGENLIAGTWLFLFDRVIHTQYLATSARGQEVGALDMVLFHVLELAQKNGFCVSFGASTESGGTVLNEGLISQKEGFGARGMVLDQYEIEL